MVLSTVWFVFAVVMLASSVVDIATYRIPNVFVLTLIVLFAMVAVVHRSEIDWLSHGASAMLVLGAGIVLYAFGQMGAGDVKLLAVAALWSGVYSLVSILFWVSVCGLAGMKLILFARMLLSATAMVSTSQRPQALPIVLGRGQGIPYGIAIGPGAILASFSFPAWIWS